jgi:O-antigen/teichoic acid export membrane protein
VGLYSLAYQFGFMLDQVGIAPFMRAWTPRRFESAHESRAVRDAKNEQGFRYLNLLAFTCAAGIAAFVGPTLRVMSHREFWQAAEIVPIILLAYIVQGWVAVLEIAIDISEQTRYVTYSVWASVVASLVFYALLIPPFGGYGAAFATLLSFLVRLAFHWRFSMKVFPVRYGWGSVLRLGCCAVIPGSAVYFSDSLGLVADIALGTTLFAIYVGAVWLFVLRASDRKAIAAFGIGRLRALAPRTAAA